MTLADIFHPVHRGRVVSNVKVIDLPDAVWTDMLAADRAGAIPTVHRSDGCPHNRLRPVPVGYLSGLALIGTAWLLATREPHELVWCGKCWSTERYCHCGAPSGQAVECTLCDRVDLDAEKRIEARS